VELQLRPEQRGFKFSRNPPSMARGAIPASSALHEWGISNFAARLFEEAHRQLLRPGHAGIKAVPAQPAIYVYGLAHIH
jgi:hypothetical protein